MWNPRNWIREDDGERKRATSEVRFHLRDDLYLADFWRSNKRTQQWCSITVVRSLLRARPENRIALIACTSIPPSLVVTLSTLLNSFKLHPGSLSYVDVPVEIFFVILFEPISPSLFYYHTSTSSPTSWGNFCCATAVKITVSRRSCFCRARLSGLFFPGVSLGWVCSSFQPARLRHFVPCFLLVCHAAKYVVRLEPLVGSFRGKFTSIHWQTGSLSRFCSASQRAQIIRLKSNTVIFWPWWF